MRALCSYRTSGCRRRPLSSSRVDRSATHTPHRHGVFRRGGRSSWSTMMVFAACVRAAGGRRRLVTVRVRAVATVSLGTDAGSAFACRLSPVAHVAVVPLSRRRWRRVVAGAGLPPQRLVPSCMFRRYHPWVLARRAVVAVTVVSTSNPTMHQVCRSAPHCSGLAARVGSPLRVVVHCASCAFSHAGGSVRVVLADGCYGLQGRPVSLSLRNAYAYGHAGGRALRRLVAALRRLTVSCAAVLSACVSACAGRRVGGT